MTPKEYLEKKDAIVFDVLGIHLLPREQIVEHELTKAEMEEFKPQGFLDFSNCTYCLKYAVFEDAGKECLKCPVCLAGNYCSCPESTYAQASERWDEEATKQDRIRLFELGEEFLNTYKPDDSTQVMFRRVVDNPLAGDLVAIFPDERFSSDGSLLSYMHVGQHGGTNPRWITEDTVSSKTTVDSYGDLKKELEELGYKNIEECSNIQAVGRTPKCLYCDSNNIPTHFICESCGDGMCDDCYYAGKEHENHYQDPAEMVEKEEAAEVFKTVFGDGYGCQCCVDKTWKMIHNMDIA